MRIRTIKPEFWTHDEIAELPPICRLLFIGLWNMADRRGRLEDRPKRIKASILPYDDFDVDKSLDQLHIAGFIVRYTINQVELIQVLGFEKHQRINGKEAETESEYPEYVLGSEREALVKHLGSTCEAPEITGREGKGKEGNGKERNGVQGGNAAKVWEPTAVQLRLGALFKRKPTTPWHANELKALKALGDIPDEELRLIEFHQANSQFPRTALLTLLRNWQVELDKARNFKPTNGNAIVNERNIGLEDGNSIIRERLRRAQEEADGGSGEPDTIL